MRKTVRTESHRQVSRLSQAEGHARRGGRDPTLRRTVGRTVERTADQRFGRTIVVGGLIGVVVVGAGVYVMGVVTGAGATGSTGLALFSAFFGGLGFGCMFGAIAGLTREQAQAQTTPEAKSAIGDYDGRTSEAA